MLQSFAGAPGLAFRSGGGSPPKHRIVGPHHRTRKLGDRHEKVPDRDG